MRFVHLVTLALFGAAVFSTSSVRGADGAPAPDARLREALRDTTLQLRTAQADLASAQAAQALLEEEKKRLTESVETLKKQFAVERESATKSTGQLRTQVEEQKATIAKFRETLERTRADLEKSNQDLQTAQAEGAKLKKTNVLIERRVADREQKNLALFLLGNEILSRYEDFGLGRALAAKEPFVGKSRVKLENLVQDYEDRLEDGRTKQ